MLKKALLLGGRSGLLGQALNLALLAAGWEVFILDREITTDRDLLPSTLNVFKPDWVFNTIAYTQVDMAEEDQDNAFNINRDLAGEIGLLAHERQCGLVHYSTDFVFDGQGMHPYISTDQAAPMSVYGQSKLAGEEALTSLGLKKFCIIRTAWLFGPFRPNFVLAILNKGRETGALQVVNDQTGSPTYTIDLARHSLELIEAGGQGLFHLVNSGQATWFELAGKALRLAGLDCRIEPIPSSAYPQKAVRPKYSVLDTQEFCRLSGNCPRHWTEALAEYVQSLRF